MPKSLTVSKADVPQTAMERIGIKQAKIMPRIMRVLLFFIKASSASDDTSSIVSSAMVLGFVSSHSKDHVIVGLVQNLYLFSRFLRM